MLRYYLPLARSLPQILFHSTDAVGTAVAVIAALLAILNPELLRLITKEVADRPQFSRWWSAVPIALLVVYGFARANYTQYRALDQRLQAAEAQLRSLMDPKAMIVFDSQDSNHVQHGLVDVEGASAGSKEPCDEYIYALGIVSLSARPVSGCRLVLEGSTPHNPSEQRLGRSMKLRNDPLPQSTGEFILNPGDRPGVYLEVLQEVVPHRGGIGTPAKIRLMYANTNRAQENWFTHRGDHLLTFRLEGDFAKPIRFRLNLTYDERRRRWNVAEDEEASR
jgi:hypothetical protein